jgi:glycosyltransferase involved in cell wall biosynthesis
MFIETVRIFFTSNRFFPDVGGIETHSRILAGFFQQAGHDVILSTQSLAAPESPGTAFDFTVVRRPCLKKLLRLHQWADLIFQNNIESRTLWPSFFHRKPVIVTIQTWIRSSSGKIRWIDRLKKRMLYRADRVVAISESVRKTTFTAATVIPNAYDDTTFKIHNGVARERDFIFVGRLVSDKGVDLLLRAFSGLPGDRRHTLTVAGTGPEEARLRAMAERLGIRERVDFAGPVCGEALASLLNAHRIAVVPSTWEEPFGIVALEAAACGCVLLGSDAGGLPEAVGPAGCLFRRGDVEDLKNQLLKLIHDDSLQEWFRTGARSHLEKHQAAVLSKKYLELIEEISTQ